MHHNFICVFTKLEMVNPVALSSLTIYFKVRLFSFEMLLQIKQPLWLIVEFQWPSFL